MFREKSFIIKVGITFILGGDEEAKYNLQANETLLSGEKKFGGTKIYFKASRYRRIKTFSGENLSMFAALHMLSEQSQRCEKFGAGKVFLSPDSKLILKAPKLFCQTASFRATSMEHT